MKQILSTSLDVKRRKDNTKTKNKKRKAKKKTELTKLTLSCSKIHYLYFPLSSIILR